MPDAWSEQSEKPSLSEREILDIEDRAQPRTPVIHEIVRRQGDEELSRPLTSLWWSGLAAGLSISFSYGFRLITSACRFLATNGSRLGF